MSEAGPSTAALAPPASSTKRLSTIAKPSQARNGELGASPVTKGKTAVTVNAKDVVSPGELCGFVDTLLSQLETRFDEMSDQVLLRMNDMSSRIDHLENAIQDLMHDGIDGTRQPQGVSPSPSPAVKR